MLQCRCKTFVSRGYLQYSQAEFGELSVCLFQGEIGDRSCLLGMLLMMRSQETLPSSSVFLSSSFCRLSPPYSLYPYFTLSSSALLLSCCALQVLLSFTFFISFSNQSSPACLTLTKNFLKLFSALSFLLLSLNSSGRCYTFCHYWCLLLCVCVSSCMCKMGAHTRASVRLQCLSPLQPLFRGHRSSFRLSAK